LNDLAKPIEDFKRLSPLAKIRDVHSASSLLYDLVHAAITEHRREIPEIPEIGRGLDRRLKLLINSPLKILHDNTNELLVIANKLVPLVAFANELGPGVRKGLVDFFRIVTALNLDGPQEKLDHALRSEALGNICVLLCASLQDRQRPIDSILEAEDTFIKSVEEDGKGFKMAGSLDASLLATSYLIAYIGVFQAPELPGVDRALVDKVVAWRELSTILVATASQTGNNARIGPFLNQLQNVLGQPNIRLLPNFRHAVQSLRDEFQRPIDPQKVN
jgi:hypothetical protein